MKDPKDIKFSLQEPNEGGKLVFLRLAAPATGQSRSSVITFGLRIDNTGGSEDVTLKEIKVSFPNSQVGGKSFPRDLKIAQGGTRDVALDETEMMKIPWPAPAKMQIDLRFDGYDPKTGSVDLAAHKNPTSQGSYNFPGRPQHMEEDEYYYFDEHVGGGFAYDITCMGWNDHHKKFLTYRGVDSDTNEGRFAWHQPVYAMADGVVVKSVSGSPNNPRPGVNFVLRRGEEERGPATAIAVTELEKMGTTALAKVRMLTGMRTQEGRLKLIVFEQTEDGEQIADLGKADGPAIVKDAKVSLAVVNKNRAVSAVVSGGKLSLTLWSISNDAMSLASLDVLTVDDIAEVRIARLSHTRVVTAARTKTGKFLLTVWKILGNPLDKFQTAPMGQGSAVEVGVFDLAVLSATRVVTAVQTGGGKLKVIVWDLALANSDTETTITRRGDTGDIEAVGEISASITSVGNQVAAAVQTAAGNLKVFFWNIDSNGKIKEAAQRELGPATLIRIALFKKTTLATAVRTDSGNLRISVWKLNLDENTNTYSISRDGDADAGAVEEIALARMNTAHTTMATAVQTESGNLKIILWQLARSNGFLIRHGSATLGYELVGYWHMSELEENLLAPGTAIQEGQRLGLLGNSGASSGPHLHVGAVKVPAGMPLADLIQKAAEDTLDLPSRPITFHNARAMVAKNVKVGGVWKNPFAVLDDDGIYFDPYAIFPGPAAELAECNDIREELKDLEGQIADLQDLLEGAVSKAPITAQINALLKQVDALKSKGRGIGCKI